MKKLTTAEFIEKAQAIHGMKYDYSAVVYETAMTKITIICPEHGAFLQVPNSHLRGSGCPACSATGLTTELFIAKAKEVHGDTYDYSQVQYTNNAAKVTIVCPTHGAFHQSASGHMRGNGCPKCAASDKGERLRKSATDAFLDKARAAHGDKYDYSKAVYVDAKTKVAIVCSEHGEFLQVPNSHLNGNGCPKCGSIRAAEGKRIDAKTFIERAQAVHGERYDYSLVEYANSDSDVVITCTIHGGFTQTPNNHQQGKGCPKCGHGTSQPELDILAIVKAAGHKAEHHYRPTWMGGKELDIYVPALKLAIEYCGTHVHNVDRNVFGAEPKHKQYHYDKWKACRDNGVTLITIYDFLWMTNRDKIVRMLNHKLQKADRRVYARQCEIVELDRATCWDFVKANHIEGTGVWKYSCTYKGLMHKGELVAVMVEQDNDIKRSCTKQGVAVIGGVSRLFKSFPAMTTMMTTNDTGSSGDYGIRITKFTLRYWWVNPNTGLSFTRRACQKHLLESKFGIPVGDLTEVQYMTARGFVRVFDSGLSYFVNRQQKRSPA